jgi:hypothetical protein
VSGLGDRLRRAAEALGLRRPGTTLVHVGRPEPLPPPPQPRRALPAPEYPACPSCGDRHAPLPHLAAGGGLAAYGRPLLSDPGRPAPLGRGPADQRPILRDQASAWRHGTPDPPPPDPELAALRAELRAGPAPADSDLDPAPAKVISEEPPPGWRGQRLADVIRRLGQRPPWA